MYYKEFHHYSSRWLSIQYLQFIVFRGATLFFKTSMFTSQILMLKTSKKNSRSMLSGSKCGEKDFFENMKDLIQSDKSGPSLKKF